MAGQDWQFATDTVAIITPYVDQARAIKARLKEAGDQADVRQIECSTVHRFQGQERDVIILDTVDAEPMKPGVLLSERGEAGGARASVRSYRWQSRCRGLYQTPMAA